MPLQGSSDRSERVAFRFRIVFDFFDFLELEVVAVSQTEEEDTRFFEFTGQYIFGSIHARVTALMNS